MNTCAMNKSMIKKKNNKHLLLVKSTIVFCFLFFTCQSLLLAQREYKKLPDNVSSSSFREYAPTLNAEGNIMIFQANMGENNRWGIYETTTPDNGVTWTDPVSLDSINNYGEANDLIGGPSISYDGNTLYYFASFKESLGSEDIFYSTRIGDKWSSPKNIGAPINTALYEGFPSVSADGQSMYFICFDTVSTNSLGSSCFSIKVAKKDEKGNWGEPVLLPAPINLGCEKAPRILSDGRSLIFSSIRAGGKGKYDLWMSKLGFNGEWSEPVNLDFVNTERDDLYASISASGETLYFLNDGEVDPKVLKKYPNMKGQEDIFTAFIPEHFRLYKNVTFQGKVFNTDDNSPVSATISVRDRSTTEKLFDLPVAEDGKYALVLTEGIDYEASVNAEGYSNIIFSEDLTELEEYKQINKDIGLFDRTDLELEIYDADLMELINADIQIKSLTTQEIITDIEIIEKENVKHLMLPIGDKYELTISKNNFKPSVFNFDLSSFVLYQKFQKSIELAPNKVELEFNIADAATQEGLEAMIFLYNTETDERIAIPAEMGADGKYKVEVRDGANYQVEVRSPRGYSFFSSKLKAGKKKNFDVALTELKPNTKLPLKDILFESNSSEIIESSYKELKRLVKLMKDNPNIVVELAAHTDDVGAENYNQKLSESRAQTVAMYVMQFNIPRARLAPRGYGESQPSTTNDTEENKAKNRRVELMVLSINN
ncbi:OmpA family protein [Flammeovirga kamogawensis]|nr:OmpA family protein [Flammeovirga kamogawensis]